MTMPGEDVTLYAIWKAKTYTVKYDANGASGTAPKDDKTYKKGDEVTIEAPGDLTLDGHEFLGWSTDPKATTASFQPNDKMPMPGEDVTLYAIWKEKEPAPAPKPEPTPGPTPQPNPGPGIVRRPQPLEPVTPVTPVVQQPEVKTGHLPKTGETHTQDLSMVLVLSSALLVTWILRRKLR